MRSAFLLPVLLPLIATTHAGAAPAPGGKLVLQPFGYKGVTLDGGPMKQQLEEVRAYYLRIPNDDLLRPYRLRAGKPAPGVELKGVYVGHGPFGQFVSGLARIYAATGDAACKEKAEALMHGWADCIEPDGYALQARKMDIVPYHYDKLVGALVDMMVYCGDKDARGYLSRITDWAVKNVAGVEKHVNDTEGNWYAVNGEWYTLSENLYRAYQATGDPKYRALAAEFEYTDFWNLIAHKANVFDRPQWRGWYHAYSHVNSFCGAGPAYAVTGGRRYLDILRSAYDFIQNQEAYATGGYGPNETLIPTRDLPGSLTTSGSHFETQCGTWAGFKMTKYLIGFTGDARYGDWMERLLINGVGAGIPMDAEGRVFYYSDYNLGGASKKLVPDPWPCCSGTRIELTADYHDLIYFHDDDNLYVNLFAPATVEWSHHRARVTVTQATRFPEAPSTELTVKVAKPRAFGICVRVPGWLSGPMTAKVNGRAVPIQVGADHWARFHRTWTGGDHLTITLPARFHMSRIDPKNEFPAAIMLGPVVMAVRSPEGNPSREIDCAKLATALKPVPGQPLNYHAGKDDRLLVRPFYQFAAGERYFLYLDPAQNAVRRTWEAYHFSQGWSDFMQWQTTTTPGATVEHAFEGDGVRVTGFFYDDAGQARVEVDGKAVGTIDEYRPVRGEAAHWDFAGLGAGPHTIRLTVLAETNPQSKGRYVNLAGFEPLPTGPAAK